MNLFDPLNKVSRRKFLRFLTYAGVAVSGGSGIFYATAVEPFNIEIFQQRIPLPGLNERLSGLRAVQLSDLHMGLFVSREQLEHAVSLTLAQKPDLVFITGDCLTVHSDTHRALADLDAALSVLVNQVPVFAIMGNHDLSDAPRALRRLFDKLGIRLLVNEIVPFQRDGAVVYIAGLDSITAGHPDVAGMVAAAPSDGPIVLLAHEPDIADQTAASGKFALQVSGHTHGGQINIPLLGPVVLPRDGRKYAAGRYQVKDMLLYTNRGIGMMHLPVRINCQPEITVFTFVEGRAGA